VLIFPPSKFPDFSYSLVKKELKLILAFRAIGSPTETLKDELELGLFGFATDNIGPKLGLIGFVLGLFLTFVRQAEIA
jgi:hypothetical protein